MAWLLRQLLSPRRVARLSAGRPLSGQPSSGQSKLRQFAAFFSSKRWPGSCSSGGVTRTATSAGVTSAAGAKQGGLEQRGLEGRQLDARGGVFFSLSFAGSLLLGVVGGACRPHVSVCDSDCDDVVAPAAAESGGGYGGAGGDDSGRDSPSDIALGGAPEGAAGTTTECARDRDCDDGHYCNGPELCQAGACHPGTPPSCEDGTSCVEGAQTAECAYAEPSPWLLLLTNRQLVGLPTAELGKRPLLTLGEYPSLDLFVGFNDVAFSPDGRHALIDYWVPDFGQQVLDLAFGEGVPKPVERVKNLPNWGVYSEPAFARDGSRALVSESGSGAYLLDLTGPTAVPSGLAVPDFEGWEIEFCQSHDAWVKTSAPSTLYSLDEGEPVANALDGEVVAVSPDGLRIWLRGEHARIMSCAANAEAGPTGLPDADGTWSPDSRWLLASFDDGSAKLFAVSGALETTELWSNETLGASAWSADGRALLVRLDDGSEPRFAYLDLAGDAPVEQPIGLPGTATIGRCSDAGCLAFLPRAAEDGLDLLWQPFASNAEPRLLAAQLSGEGSLVWADFTGQRLVLQRATDTGSQLTLTDFQATPELSVFDWPGTSIDARPASDGSGLLLQLSDDTGYSNFWLKLPDPDAGVEASVVPLDIPAYRSAFQPWRRKQP